MIRLAEHPRPWVAKFGIVGEGANVYDVNDQRIFEERLDLSLAMWIAQTVNDKAADARSAADADE